VCVWEVYVVRRIVNDNQSLIMHPFAHTHIHTHTQPMPAVALQASGLTSGGVYREISNAALGTCVWYSIRCSIVCGVVCGVL
jgi:hypothetical protein